MLLLKFTTSNVGAVRIYVSYVMVETGSPGGVNPILVFCRFK